MSDLLNELNGFRKNIGNSNKKELSEIEKKLIAIDPETLNDDEKTLWQKLIIIYANNLISINCNREACIFLAKFLITTQRLINNPYAHKVYARAMIRYNQPGRAAAWLAPMVAKGKLLEGDAYAHTTYANALIQSGGAAAAAKWLAPRIKKGELLETDAVAHFTMAKAEICQNESQRAIPHINNAIKYVSRDIDKIHAVALLATVSVDDNPVLLFAKKIFEERQWQTVEKLRDEWRDEENRLKIGLPSSAYYGLMPPLEKIGFYKAKGVNADARGAVRGAWRLDEARIG